MTDERRSGKTGTPPTIAFRALQQLEPWKKNVMFVVGVAGVLSVGYWFLFFDKGQAVSKMQLIAAAALAVVFLWMIVPEFISRHIDKYLPDKWRKDSRK